MGSLVGGIPGALCVNKGPVHGHIDVHILRYSCDTQAKNTYKIFQVAKEF
jgi:hypothetical protein